MGENLTFSITPERVGGKSLTVTIEVRHGDELRVGARQVLVFTDLGTHRAIDIPADVRAALEKLHNQ
jgi:4-hydroxybenzoyl-CoA thioesterase